MNNSGLTTIEEVNEFLKKYYEKAHIWSKIQMKAWAYLSNSRNRNGNPPFTFDNYVNHMNERYYLEQIEFGMIECDDIGGKEAAIKFLQDRIN